ncbi:uncharacterized protein LOC107634209 isoform X2 [Arachis ipaensis]|uniref:uncharacterized protein LOC107634209 isoform X2 n=1 Tax=Arachis ipaensis TaxID=130454 RepID=UPI000A2B35F7|nr:uncharacterized protein LOC107634209 isoform X2 [Arachis ipaensis]
MILSFKSLLEDATQYFTILNSLFAGTSCPSQGSGGGDLLPLGTGCCCLYEGMEYTALLSRDCSAQRRHQQVRKCSKEAPTGTSCPSQGSGGGDLLPLGTGCCCLYEGMEYTALLSRDCSAQKRHQQVRKFPVIT